MAGRGDPAQHAAPVVAHEVEGLHLHAVGQGHDVVEEMLGGVVGYVRRPGATAVAAQVRGDGAVPRSPESPQLVSPGPRRLREAVQQQDPVTLVRTAGATCKGEAAGFDLEPVDRPDRVHDVRLRARLNGGGTTLAFDFIGTETKRLLGDRVDEFPLGHIVV